MSHNRHLLRLLTQSPLLLPTIFRLTSMIVSESSREEIFINLGRENGTVGKRAITMRDSVEGLVHFPLCRMGFYCRFMFKILRFLSINYCRDRALKFMQIHRQFSGYFTDNFLPKAALTDSDTKIPPKNVLTNLKMCNLSIAST